MKAAVKVVMTLLMAAAVTGVTAQPQHGKRDVDPEQMAKRMVENMTNRLGLSEQQQKDLYDLQLKMIGERPQARRDASGPPSAEEREARKKEMDKAMDDYNAGIKKILTEEQFEKWTELRKERMQDRGNGDKAPRKRRGVEKNTGKQENCNCCQACDCPQCTTDK